jgi:hypothetical protein
LMIPQYDPRNAQHKQLAKLAKAITASTRAPSVQQQRKLTETVAAMFTIPDDVLTSLSSVDDAMAHATAVAQTR